MAAEPRMEQDDGVDDWLDRFVGDLAVIRSANTVRAYAADVQRWVTFCRMLCVDPFCARPTTAIAFIRAERERTYRANRT
jgi:hypothetical protein